MNIYDLYKNYKKNRLPSTSSIANYKSLLKVFHNDTCTTNIYEIDHGVIIKWRDLVLSRARITTWNTYLRQMRALFQFAVESKYLTENVFLTVKTKSVYQLLPKTLSDLELLKVINFLENNGITYSVFWLAMVRILYSTGMRRKQLIYLNWGDLNINNKTLLLSAQGSKTKREYLIPLFSKNIEDLLILKGHTIRVTGKEIQNNSQIFNLTIFNKAYKKDKFEVADISTFFKKISKILNISISAHKIRHTVATKIANSGGNITDLQNLLGHSTPLTTMRYIEPNLKSIQQTQSLLKDIIQ